MAKKQKTRSQMKKYYENEYKTVPTEIHERVSLLCDTLNLQEEDISELKMKIDEIKNINTKTICIILYEFPMATDRPHFSSKNNCFFVLNAQAHKKDMLEVIKKLGLYDTFITTPIELYLNLYFPIPDNMERIDKVLAELKLIEPQLTPDWDNCGKTYSDALKSSLFLDDMQISKAHVYKYYSIKPRVEIVIRYKEKYQSEYQAKAIHRSRTYKKIISEGKDAFINKKTKGNDKNEVRNETTRIECITKEDL